jgi:hypothetical protein
MGDTGAILCERMILMFCGDCGCLSRPAALAWSAIVWSNDHFPNIGNRDASRPCGGGSFQARGTGEATRGECQSLCRRRRIGEFARNSAGCRAMAFVVAGSGAMEQVVWAEELAEMEAIQVGWLPSLIHVAVGPCCVRILLWCIAETPVINHDTPVRRRCLLAQLMFQPSTLDVKLFTSRCDSRVWRT